MFSDPLKLCSSPFLIYQPLANPSPLGKNHNKYIFETSRFFIRHMGHMCLKSMPCNRHSSWWPLLGSVVMHINSSQHCRPKVSEWAFKQAAWVTCMHSNDAELLILSLPVNSFWNPHYRIAGLLPPVMSTPRMGASLCPGCLPSDPAPYWRVWSEKYDQSAWAPLPTSET